MIIVENWIKESSKLERQSHINLSEPCLIRGGSSTQHKGVLAQFLNSTIPHGTKNGIHLCHACHNGECSNPKHLYWGTPSENIQDAIDNGTHGSNKVRGRRRGPRPLSERLQISATMTGRPSNNKKGINGASTGNRTKIPRGYERKYKQVWINNGLKQTRIKEGDPIPLGYTRGRL